MAVSIGYVAYGVAAAAAVGSYVEQKKAGKRQVDAANAAATAASYDAQANNQAAANAAAKDKAAKAATANEQLAAQQMNTQVQATVDDGTSDSARRRIVGAQFDLGNGPAGNTTGSIRV